MIPSSPFLWKKRSRITAARFALLTSTSEGAGRPVRNYSVMAWLSSSKAGAVSVFMMAESSEEWRGSSLEPDPFPCTLKLNRGVWRKKGRWERSTRSSDRLPAPNGRGLRFLRSMGFSPCKPSSLWVKSLKEWNGFWIWGFFERQYWGARAEAHATYEDGLRHRRSLLRRRSLRAYA